MESILSIVEKLFPFAYSITGAGNDAAIPAYLDEFVFEIHEYESGRDINGWVIPQAHRVETALIRNNGDLIYDGTRSPLGVIAQSTSFTGRLGLDELKSHLHVDPLNPDAVPYHWRQLYGRGAADWGFAMPSRLYDGLPDGEYDVELLTHFEPATMKVLVATLPGETEQTVMFNAHNCHPHQANDDISGVAVGLAVMRALAARPLRRLTYQLMVAPELLGPLFWLTESCPDPERIVGAVLLKAVGNDGPIKLQESYTGKARIDLAAHAAMRSRFANDYTHGQFRSIYGNDEIIFEAPGFEIPAVELTRVPFATYHCDFDRPDRLSESALAETRDLALAIADNMERDRRYRRTFRGIPCLSNPKYDLYLPTKDRRLPQDEATLRRRQWNRMMNCLPRDLDGRTTLLQVADRHGIAPEELEPYLARWVDKGLAEVID